MMMNEDIRTPGVGYLMLTLLASVFSPSLKHKTMEGKRLSGEDYANDDQHIPGAGGKFEICNRRFMSCKWLS